MDDRQKKWIDESTYEGLLHHWRFAPAGDPMFVGDTGKYYEKVMAEKREQGDPVAASKAVGWEKP